MPTFSPQQLRQLRAQLAQAAVVSRAYDEASARAVGKAAPAATRLKSITLYSPDGQQTVTYRGPDDQVDAVEALLVRALRSLDGKFKALGGKEAEACANPFPDFLVPGTQRCPYVLPVDPEGVQVEEAVRVGPVVYKVVMRVRGERQPGGGTWIATFRTRLTARRDGKTDVWSVMAGLG